MFAGEPWESIAEAGRYLVRRALTWGASGNLSIRLDADRFLVSATGVPLDSLDREGLAVCRLDRSDHEGPQPSVEHGMHRAVYLGNSESGAVLHASPPHATLVACSRLEAPVMASTDTALYVGRVERVAFAAPGSEALAGAAGAASRRSRALLLDGHGALTWGATLQEAVIRLEALELACRLLVLSRAAGIELVGLTPEQAASLDQV